MKQSTAENTDYLSEFDDGLASEEAPPQAGKRAYAQTLRNLGHALEAHHFLAFEIEVKGDTYVVKGSIPPAEPDKPSFMRSLQNLFATAGAAARTKPREIELRYSVTELASLDARVRRQRSLSPEIPDPHSLSQLLRGIGCYLDKRAHEQLVSVAMKDRWVEIVHRSQDGKSHNTREDIEYFYNFWIKMYMQRSSRPAQPPLSDPTHRVAR